MRELFESASDKRYFYVHHNQTFPTNSHKYASNSNISFFDLATTGDLNFKDNNHIRRITIENGASVNKISHYYTATAFTMGEMVKVSDFSLDDYEHKMELLKQNGTLLRFMKIQDYGMCTIAVSQNGLALQYVNLNHRDHDLYVCAVKQNPYALEFVDHQTDEICEIAIDNHIPDIGHFYNNKFNNKSVLKFINNKTYELCGRAVKKDGCEIRYVPQPDYNSKSECTRYTRLEIAAVRQNGLSIYYIENPSYIVQMEAVRQNGFALRHITPYVQHYDVCLEAVKQNGLALPFVLNQTTELCQAAINNNKQATQYMKQHISVFGYVLNKMHCVGISGCVCGTIFGYITSKYLRK
jgi:hypothetical protein